MKENGKTIMSMQDLAIGYEGHGEPNRILAKELNLSIREGELICLLGPNGTGKSTLMRTLAGLQKPLKGQVYIKDLLLKNRHFKSISRLLSIVLTEKVEVGNLSVFQIVSLGRYPHINWLGKLGQQDNEKIRWALEQVHLLHYASRHINELSDGEKQRVMIAKALAQDTPLILLDEPTAHLDLPNRVAIMNLLRNLARTTGKGILLSTHELDLALQAADTIWLMDHDQPLLVGAPEDLVLNGSFEKVFANKALIFDKNTGSFRLNHTICQEVFLEGNSILGLWTRRALEREGYQVTSDSEKPLRVAINSQNRTWELNCENHKEEFPSIGELVWHLRQIQEF